MVGCVQDAAEEIVLQTVLAHVCHYNIFIQLVQHNKINTMKTIQKGELIKKADDIEADIRVRNQGWKYVPKSTLKQIKESEEKTKEEKKKK
jgi:hypothetical protein